MNANTEEGTAFAVSYSASGPAALPTMSFFIPAGPAPAGATPPHAPVKITLADSIREVLNAKQIAKRRPRTLRAMRQYLTAFARGRESMPLADVTVELVEQWFDSRTEKPNTKKSNLGRLSSLFSYAVRRRWMPENPTRRIEIPFVDREPPKILTVEECDVLLHWALHNKPPALAWFVLTLLVGLRPESEADPLTWEQIDLERGRIRVAAAGTKVRQHRIIDLNLTPAVPWLKLAKELGSRLPMPYSTRRKYLRQARDVLGFAAWPPDVLRHTAASYMLAKHQDAGKVAYVLGNSASIIHRHYKALVEPEDAERWFALLPHEPDQAAPAPPLLKYSGESEPRRIPNVLSVADCDGLLRCIRYQRPKALGWLTLTLLCGATEAETSRIGWSDIDLQSGLMQVRNEGTAKRKARLIQIPENARLWLAKAKEVGAMLPVHPRAPRGFYRYVKVFLPTIPYLAIRDTCCCYTLAHIGDVKRAADVLGMSRRALYREFAGMVTQADAEAFFALKPL